MEIREISFYSLYRAQQGRIIVYVVFKNRTHDLYLSCFNMKLPNSIDPQTKLTFALPPLFYSAVRNSPHYSPC